MPGDKSAKSTKSAKSSKKDKDKDKEKEKSEKDKKSKSGKSEKTNKKSSRSGKSSGAATPTKSRSKSKNREGAADVPGTPSNIEAMSHMGKSQMGEPDPGATLPAYGQHKDFATTAGNTLPGLHAESPFRT